MRAAPPSVLAEASAAVDGAGSTVSEATQSIALSSSANTMGKAEASLNKAMSVKGGGNNPQLVQAQQGMENVSSGT